jgi:uncharacterized membrane protein YjfL (UPF0719 family)
MLSSFDLYFAVLAWIFALVIILSMAMPALVWVTAHLLNHLDVYKELKRGNTAIAIVIASIVIGVSLVVALAIK